MWPKWVITLSLVAVLSRITYCESLNNYFRKDYLYIDETKSFYKINTAVKTWAEAKRTCRLENAALFYPDNKDEAIAVNALLNVTQPFIDQIYIGVAGWNVNNYLETIDGKPISDAYNIWAMNETYDAGEYENCVVMQEDGTLRREDCNNQFPFLCKKKQGTFQWNNECAMSSAGYEYNSILNRCYKFHLTPMNWTDAYIQCNSEESYLAILNSPYENKYLVNLTAEAPKDDVAGFHLRGAVHLGFHKQNGFWETIKGVPLYESGFCGWGYTQPDGGDNESCGSMFYTGELNDIGCYQRMFFICEHELDPQSNDINLP